MYRNDYKITDDGFGVHTFELTIPSLTREKFERLKNKARAEYCGNDRNDCFIYSAQRGIRIYYNHTDQNFFNINVIVSPRKLIDKNAEPVSILRASNDFDLLEFAVNEALSEHLGDGYNMDSFSLSRVDVCVNIMLSESFSAQRYVKLIRRSMIYSDNAKIMTYPENSFNAKQKNEHSFRITTGDVTFTAYDKYFQLEDIGEKYDASSEALLRLELALNRDHIRNFKNSLPGDAKNIDLIYYFTYSGRDSFEDYIKRHFFTGDYYSLADMKNLIEKSKLKKKARERMVKYADMQCDKRSYQSAKESMRLILCSKSKLKKLFRDFDIWGIYPISLPYRDMHGKNAVPGLHKILGL